MNQALSFCSSFCLYFFLKCSLSFYPFSPTLSIVLTLLFKSTSVWPSPSRWRELGPRSWGFGPGCGVARDPSTSGSWTPAPRGSRRRSRWRRWQRAPGSPAAPSAWRSGSARSDGPGWWPGFARTPPCHKVGLRRWKTAWRALGSFLIAVKGTLWKLAFILWRNFLTHMARMFRTMRVCGLGGDTRMFLRNKLSNIWQRQDHLLTLPRPSGSLSLKRLRTS